ncbi:hypothetical protein RKD32_006999 [Streptomyces sp. SAI-195]
MHEAVGLEEFDAQRGGVQPCHRLVGHQPRRLVQQYDAHPLAAAQRQVTQQLDAVRGEAAEGRGVQSGAEGVEVLREQRVEPALVPRDAVRRLFGHDEVLLWAG